MNGLIDNLKSLGRTRLMILAGVGTAILVSIIVFMTLLSRPAMSPVYSGMDPAEAAQMVRVIEQMGIPYEMQGDGAVIAIPRSEFGRVRMALAENGLPSKGGVGYEVFDDAGTLGMTSFMQQVNRLRALEGELARTIQSVNGIHAARVHLVLPEREAFSREAPDPSASVVIRTTAGFSLERAQALAIRHLVSSSVPNLKRSAVTVMDTTGRLLLADDGGDGEASASSVKASIESRIARNLEKLLSARVGAGNVRVQVSAELNTMKQVTRSETYDPSGQVPRSTQLVEEGETSQSNEDSVTVEQNLPMMELDNGPSSASTRNRTEETTNYEISNTVMESILEPGEVNRLSVAVLVNGEYVNEDGSTVYRDRSEEELQRIRGLVEAAIGFDGERGDTVAVDSMQFVDYAFDLGDPVGVDFKTVLADNLMDIIRVLAALAGLVVLVFGLRPFLNRVLPKDLREVVGAPGAAEEDEAALATAAVAAPGSEPEEGEEDDGATVNIAQVSGDIKASKINRLTEIIEANQEEAIKVMKAWVAKE